MRLQDHISGHFCELYATHRKESARVRKSGSEEAIHDLRVASRRILETLRVFEGAIDADVAGPVRRALKRWMRLSGSVRDLDIASELAGQCGVGDAVGFANEWLQKRNQRWSQIEKRLTAKVGAGGFGNAARLVPDSAAPPQSVIWDYGLSAAQNASAALPLLLHRYLLHGNAIPALDAANPPEDAVYHRFRLRTKRFRYTLEAFQAFYPQVPFRELLGRLKNFQQILGWLHDCEVAAELVQSAQGYSERTAGQKGELATFLVARTSQLRQDWQQAWLEFAAPDFQRVVYGLLRETAADPSPQPLRKKARKEAREFVTRQARQVS
jgi:CHAD domain-containing protein